MRDPSSPPGMSRLTLLGLIWVWSVLALLGLGFVSSNRTQPPEGWALTVFACLMIGIFLTGLGLLGALIFQPWVTRGAKPPAPAPRSVSLWDRELDG